MEKEGKKLVAKQTQWAKIASTWVQGVRFKYGFKFEST